MTSFITLADERQCLAVDAGSVLFKDRLVYVLLPSISFSRKLELHIFLSAGQEKLETGLRKLFLVICSSFSPFSSSHLSINKYNNVTV